MVDSGSSKRTRLLRSGPGDSCRGLREYLSGARLCPKTHLADRLSHLSRHSGSELG